MNTHEFTTTPSSLIALAGCAILAQEPVRLALPENWIRPRNFPLPIKKTDGAVKEYRPLAILEWVNDELAGVNAAAAARKRILETRTAP